MSPLARRVGSAVLIASILTFIWSAMFWMNPLPYRALERLPDEEAAGTALLEHFPESGTYVLPGFYNDMSNLEPLRRGPLAMLYISRQGEPTPWPTILGRGVVVSFASIVLLGLLLVQVLPSLPEKFAWRVLVVTGFGFVSALFTHLADVVWWFHPVRWHLVILGYTLVLWLIAGCVFALFLDPSAVREEQGGLRPEAAGAETEASIS